MQVPLQHSVKLAGRTAPPCCGLSSAFDELALGFVARPEFVAGLLQRIKGRPREFFLH